MSRRTAEANKAVRLAWQREYDLIQEGKGTRDWTEEQQRDILDLNKGKAYDDMGRSFEGQHMKSVEKYSEYQGDPDNIQFLTKLEHLEAHQGNWQNPTNWYYDPVTKQIFDFGEGKYVPCPVIELSEPIMICTNVTERGFEKTDSNAPKQDDKMTEEPRSPSSTTKSNSRVKSTVVKPQTTTKKVRIFNCIKDGATNGLKKAGKFVIKHKEVIGVIVLTACGALLEGKIRNSNSSGERSYTEVPFDDNGSSLDYEECAADSDYSDSSSDYENEENESVNGTQKSPHPRRGYSGHRWKKNEDDELELRETWINETYIHKDQIDDDSE